MVYVIDLPENTAKFICPEVVMARFANFFARLTGATSGRSEKPGSGQGKYDEQVGVPLIPEIEDAVGFHFAASDKLIGLGSDERLHRVIKAFAPSQPVMHIADFAGRRGLLQQIVAAVEEHRNHVVIFGGRGTGKTSIAMALLSVARRAGYHCAYTSCSRDSTLTTIFSSALSTLPLRFDQYFDARDETANAGASFADLLPDHAVSAQELVDILARIRGTRLLVVIDEFDRNENPVLTRDVTEVMKVMSDLAINCQIVMAGVGDVAESLVGEHASVARALYPVRVTAMKREEILDTLALASTRAGVALAPDVIEAVVSMASGRPYIARLVGLKASKFAMMRGADTAEMVDLDKGIGELLDYLVAAGFGEVEQLALASNVNLVTFVAIFGSHRDAADRFTVEDVIATLGPVNSQRDISGAIAGLLERMATPEYGVLHVDIGEDGRRRYKFLDPRVELFTSLICFRAEREVRARSTNFATRSA